MNHAKDPLAWWELSGTRRAVAISVIVGLLLASLALFPNVSRIYDKHSALRNCLGGLIVVLGLLLSFLELRHSGEANDYRAEQNRLTGEANKFREEANSLKAVNNELYRERLKLQVRVQELQEGIEKKLTKIRLYARALADGPKVQLLVSNLSEFDLWINRVELTVTEGGRTGPNTRILGGGSRISRGHTEAGYNLHGELISINGDRTDKLAMKFHIKVTVTGVDDDPATIKSPDYSVSLEHGGPPEIKVLKY
jgi:hypothetical protein